MGAMNTLCIKPQRETSLILDEDAWRFRILCWNPGLFIIYIQFFGT